VLQDLLACPDSPLEPEDTIKQILFSPESPGYRPTLADVLARGSTNKWDKLSPAELAHAQQAADHLVRRSQEKDAFKGFKPKDKRIIVWDNRRAEAGRDADRRRLRPQVFQAFPPGYSKDAQLAMVHLNFPWSVHSGTGTYVLARKQGGWVVIIRIFVYFLRSR
jgi:hypothetical protein